MFGDIKKMPLENELSDVVVSNCVLNLVPDKNRAFSETFRILKADGHFSISDVVIRGSLPPVLQKDVEMYAGCVGGVIDMDAYLFIIREAGFVNITLQKKKPINSPDTVLKKYMSKQEIDEFCQSDKGISA